IDQPLRNGSVFSSEYFSLISGSGIPTPSCSMVTFDLEGTHATPLGSHCLLNIDNLALHYRFSPYYQKDHLLYLLTTESPDAATAYLRSYDIKTDVIEPVLQS